VLPPFIPVPLVRKTVEELLRRAPHMAGRRELIWSDPVKLSGTGFWFFVLSAPASHVPAGAARRDSRLA